VKTASEMTYTMSGGALNSTQSNPIRSALYSAFYSAQYTMSQ